MKTMRHARYVRRVGLLALLFAPLWGCGDDGPAPKDVDASEVDTASDIPDSTAVELPSDVEDADDVADTAETLDVADTADTLDVADTVDTLDVADATETADTQDVADTAPEVETIACDFEPGDPDFNDHTITHIPSVDCFYQYAGAFAREPVEVKFLVVDMNAGTPSDATLRFSENGFYQLHDEWYWFRLLNGHAIPDLADPQPVQGLSFPTIASIYQALARQTVLPLDMSRLDGGRLYSKRFYDLAAFGSPANARFFGLGTLVHYDANPERVFPDEVWGFELEFVDRMDVVGIERMWTILEAKLPPEIASKLRWITRSTFQDAVAVSMRQSGNPRGLRTLSSDDLVIDGAVEVYNEGITAGFAKILDADFSPADLRSDELAVLPRVPDDIPPSRAIISAVPQTALAHVNLLAKSRGTPNAYVAGIASWGQLAEWAYMRQPLVFEATVANGVRWTKISFQDYTSYLTQLAPPVRHVQQIDDLASAPLTLSLTDGGIADMKGLVPLIGGKSAGFLSFIEVPSMNTPDLPLAVSIKPFVEHQAEFLPWLKEAVRSDAFADSRVRFLVLEGESAYVATYGRDPTALALLEMVRQAHVDDAIGEILKRGGARQMLLDKPMKYETLRALRAALEARFALLAPTQGLRFRSSSTAEDVPGFNGAGLYVSNTGYLFPSQLSDPSDRAKTIENAIKQTWSSYWGFQAFEERRAGQIDHFEGNMALAVHPRFDNHLERANAVATFWVNDYVTPPTRRLVMNVQKGAMAVTNPGGTLELPEVDVVDQVGDGAPVVTRVQRSTVAEADEWLFTEAELVGMFAQANEHAERWLVQQGAALTPSERPKALVLDYELKFMWPGWPALASGETRPGRIIWRQARVLDQVTRVTPALTDPWNGASLPLATYLPVDLRTAARTVIVDRCNSDVVDLRVYKVFTESSMSDLFPFAASAFVYKVIVDFKQAPPGLAPSLNNWLIQWTNLIERKADQSGTRIVLNAGIANTMGIDGFELSPVPGTTFKVWKGATEYSGTCVRETQQPFRSAADFLRGLIATP